MMQCIIIDDEPLAHKVIRNYAAHLEFLDFINSFKGAVEALSYLNTHTVDLIFLDINMPVLKGLDFLRTLQHPPMIIITSAYQEYALESYELEVIDYLLKPFSFERFLKAVNKANHQKSLVEASMESTVKPNLSGLNEERIFVKSEKKTHQIRLQDVLFLEGAGSYVKIHVRGESKENLIITFDRLTNFEKSLPADNFVRVHKSFVVAVSHIDAIEGNRIMIGDHTIPIGQVYKMNLSKWMGG